MRIAGLGFRSLATMASFDAALALIPGADAVATAEDKAPALAQFAQKSGLALIAVPLAALKAHPRPGSPRVQARYGTGSLAESAALAAAGPGARLLQSRLVTPDRLVTIALAESTP